MEQRRLDLEEPVKAEKLRPRKEFALHCQLGDILRQFIKPAWKATHLPMGEYRTPATRGRLKRMYVTPGWPDFMFVGPKTVLWLELKRGSRARLSDDQINVRSHLMRCGFPYLVTSDLQDAINTLQDFDILPMGIRVQ